MFKDGRRGQSSAQAGVGHAEEIRKASGGEPIYSELEVLKVTATKNHDLMELNRGIETLRNMGLGEVEIVPLKPLPLWWTDDSTDNQKPRNEEKDEQPDLLDYLFGGTLQKPKPKPGPKPDLLDSLFNGTLPNERKAMPKHQKPQSVQYREIITFDGSPDMLKTFHKYVTTMIRSQKLQSISIQVVEHKRVQVGQMFFDDVLMCGIGSGGGAVEEEKNIAVDEDELHPVRAPLERSPSILERVDSVLDSVFTDDFSKNFPGLHNAMTIGAGEEIKGNPVDEDTDVDEEDDLFIFVNGNDTISMDPVADPPAHYKQMPEKAMAKTKASQSVAEEGNDFDQQVDRMLERWCNMDSTSNSNKDPIVATGTQSYSSPPVIVRGYYVEPGGRMQ